MRGHQRKGGGGRNGGAGLRGRGRLLRLRLDLREPELLDRRLVLRDPRRVLPRLLLEELVPRRVLRVGLPKLLAPVPILSQAP